MENGSNLWYAPRTFLEEDWGGFVGEKKIARGGTRTPMPCGMRPSNARVCHFTTRAEGVNFRTSLTQCKREIWGNALAA